MPEVVGQYCAAGKVKDFSSRDAAVTLFLAMVALFSVSGCQYSGPEKRLGSGKSIWVTYKVTSSGGWSAGPFSSKTYRLVINGRRIDDKEFGSLLMTNPPSGRPIEMAYILDAIPVSADKFFLMVVNYVDSHYYVVSVSKAADGSAGIKFYSPSPSQGWFYETAPITWQSHMTTVSVDPQSEVVTVDEYHGRSKPTATP